MPELSITIKHKAGLHARPASLFVQTAARYSSEIKVVHGERTINAKSILSVLTLGANQGAEITIQAEGPDALDALAALQELVNNNFGEE